MPRESNDFIILTGTSNIPLAKKIAKKLKKDIDESISFFPDGEIRVRIPHNLRQRDVFIIQPTFPQGNDQIMQLIFMIDAARRASAREITAVIPYYGYSRQDRKEMPRVPISSSVVANMIESAGADRILTIDIHSDQQQGFTKIPCDNLYGSYSIIPAIKKRTFSGLRGGLTYSSTVLVGRRIKLPLPELIMLFFLIQNKIPPLLITYNYINLRIFKFVI